MRLLRTIVVALLAACSGKEAADVKSGGSAGSGGGAGEPSGGGAGEPSDGGAAGSAGSVATGSGAAAGSGASAGSNTGGANGGEAGGGGAGASGGGLVLCDHRQVLCKSVEPPCPEMQVARVEDGCWGACTDIHLCACSSAEECPHEETYTCWGKEHCGPYVR